MADYKSSYTGQEIDAGIAKANTALQEEQYTGTYSKPSGGIPESDLSESVQDKLNSGGGGAALSEEFKTALLDCFENVAWINDDGQEYYDALYDTLYGSKTLESINAVFTQGSNVIYNDSSLESLKQYLVVTALYNDSSTQVVTNYTLSGTLTAGSSTITVTYEGKTDTFDVTVTARPTVVSIEATYTQGTQKVYTTDSLDKLKTNLVVTATYSDTSTEVLQDNDYTLSGTLSVGTSTITATYSGKTDTFSVSVTVSPTPTLSSISATYTQTETVYATTPLNDLKNDLVVIATYSDSTTRTIASTDYTLSGTLTEGTSTITVTYEGKTDTFDVTVTAWDFEWYATSGVLPDGMTHEGVEWGTNNEYANIIHPNYQLAYSDLEAEIECAWIDIVSPGNAADTQINFSKTQGDAVKLFLSNTNATDVIFSGYNNGVSAPYTLNVNRSDFHKYHVIFKDGVGSLYVDGNFVVSRESFYGIYNFYPLIYSRNNLSNANKLAIKSIKWRVL